MTKLTIWFKNKNDEIKLHTTCENDFIFTKVKFSGSWLQLRSTFDRLYVTSENIELLEKAIIELNEIRLILHLGDVSRIDDLVGKLNHFSMEVGE